MNTTWAIVSALLALLSVAICIVALFVVPVNRKPSSATAWLMLIFGLPYLGAILFLLLGSPKLSRRRRAQQRTMDDVLHKAVVDARQLPALQELLDPPIPPRFAPLVRLNTNLGGLPPFAGNRVELLPDYTGAVDCIIEAIERAKRYVHVEYFEFADDATGGKVIDALLRAQERGVQCRVLIDHIGNFFFNRPVVKRLRAGNVPVHLMLPVRLFDNEWLRLDLRNHRKIVVVDGEVGFTGSQNLIDWDYHKRSNIKKGLYYVELVARVIGPIVHQLNAAFLTDWYAETGELLVPSTASEIDTIVSSQTPGNVLCQVLPSGPGFENDNNLKLFVALCYAAQQTITIANPYFVPDEALMTALTSAAQRGVNVRLIVSEIGDQFFVYHAQRSYYEALLAAGVQIYRYRSPVLLHAKHMSIDDDIAVIGSSNMDMRSFQLDLEVTLLCYGNDVVTEMEAIFADYLRHARPVRLHEWRIRPLITRLFDNLARLTSALQ
jgi:cardiolipin synthase